MSYEVIKATSIKYVDKCMTQGIQSTRRFKIQLQHGVLYRAHMPRGLPSMWCSCPGPNINAGGFHVKPFFGSSAFGHWAVSSSSATRRLFFPMPPKVTKASASGDEVQWSSRDFITSESSTFQLVCAALHSLDYFLACWLNPNLTIIALVVQSTGLLSFEARGLSWIRKSNTHTHTHTHTLY